MNRSETKLLVENWRNLISSSDGNVNTNDFVLNESLLVENFLQNFTKKIGGSKVSTAIQSLGFMLMMSQSPNANASLKGVPQSSQDEYNLFVQYALKHVDLSNENKERLIKLAAKIQSDKDFEPSPDDLKFLDFCIEKYESILEVVDQDLDDAEKEYKKSVDAAKKAAKNGSMDDVYDADADLSEAQKELQKAINRFKLLKKLTFKFVDKLEGNQRTISATSDDGKTSFKSVATYTGL